MEAELLTQGGDDPFRGGGVRPPEEVGRGVLKKERSTERISKGESERMEGGVESGKGAGDGSAAYRLLPLFRE